MSRAPRAWAAGCLSVWALFLAASAAARETGAPAAAPEVASSAEIARFAGRRITRVDTIADETLWRAATVKIGRVRVGDTLTLEVARDALDEVLATGHFATGRVSAVLDGTGVRLVVRVVPRKLVADVRAEMRYAKVDRDEVLREADFVAGVELTAESVEDRRQKLLHAFSRHGYPHAVVDIVTRETDDVDAVFVVLDINPGAPEILGGSHVYLVGAPDGEGPLRNAANGYTVGGGDRLDEAQIAAADGELAQRVQKIGYFQAKVSHDVTELDGAPFLRVRVDTGPLLVPRFEGNEHFDPDALSGALKLEEDADRSPGALVARLEAFYRARGYFDVEVRLEMRGDESAPVRHMVFHIVEHPRVSVSARVYPCLREDDLRGDTGDAPKSADGVGREIDSFLDEELPGADLLRATDPAGTNALLQGDYGLPGSKWPIPIELDPYTTYVPETYDRALDHVRSLYENAGYLNVKVGPIGVLRRQCRKDSPPDACIAMPLPPMPPERCTYDAANLPLQADPLPPSLTCKPDPQHGIACEPRVVLRVPLKLGPRTFLYDVGFRGASTLPEKELLTAAELQPGEPVSLAKLEEATRKVLDHYKDEGFAYAQVEYAIEPSPDHTRARVRFDITEGERVYISDIVVEGNNLTRASVILRRSALVIGEKYSVTDARRTQERVATLGVFASVDVALEAPYLQARRKRVVIRVVERPPQYIELRPGLSTGEGVRLAAEYGNRNIGMSAIGLSGRIQLSYLPDFLIFDEVVRNSFKELKTGDRIAARGTVSLALPDIGLSPLFRGGIDALVAQDLQRGYLLKKVGLIATIVYRPMAQLQFSLAQSFEYNDFTLLGDPATQKELEDQIKNDPNLARLLRVPYGQSAASAQRFLATWDRRDNAFNAHRGTLVVGGIEHVDYYGLPRSDPAVVDGHFFRLTATLSGYIPLGKRLVFAAQLRVGGNVHLVPKSETYPDRLFFLGGADNMRGFYQDQLVPADLAAAAPDVNPGIRGGDLMVNPRAELRIPIVGGLETVAFCDTGNVWVEPGSLQAFGGTLPFALRVSVGTGIRWNSPVGIPLVLDIGFPIDRRSYEPVVAPQFAMGLF